MACSKMAEQSSEPSEFLKLQEENQKLKNILYKGRFDTWVFETLFNGGEIEICTLDGNCIPMEVRHSTKISDVKKYIKLILEIPDEIEFRLCFGGSRGSAILEEHRTLFYYRIPVGAAIHMLMEESRGTHQIMSQNMTTEKEIFDDLYYLEYYEKVIKESNERKKRYSSSSRKGKRVGWTGIPPDQNKKIEN
jgi:hypothetical protein